MDSRERGTEEEREGQKHGWERNINQLPLVHVLTRTEPATQACALTRN